MKNIINIFKKIFKKKNYLIKVFFVSFLTSIFVITLTLLFLWFFRFEFFRFLANNLPKEKTEIVFIEGNEEQNIKKSDSVIQKEERIEKEPLVYIPKDNIVDVVKKANPAVASILLLKEGPKYNITYKYESTLDENGDPIPGLYQKKEIKTEDGTEYKQVSSGTGFLINQKGLIVTNKHVVNKEGDFIYKVLLNDGSEYEAKVLAKDNFLDIAFLKIEAFNLPYLSLGDSDNLEVGQSVIAIGNALGEFKNTVSSGIISGLSRSIISSDKYGISERLDEVIQTDAAINKGNSGGPLLDLKGDVVGINVAVVEDSSNIGFALPVNSIKDIIKSVEQTGRIIRPYVGIRYISITELVKTKYDLPVNYGILIKKGKDETEPAIIAGSPAEKSGIKEDDIILEVGGVKIDVNNDFSYLIRNKKIGDILIIKILSGGIEKYASVVLEESPNWW